MPIAGRPYRARRASAGLCSARYRVEAETWITVTWLAITDAGWQALAGT
jgi:hypothetical protein